MVEIKVDSFYHNPQVICMMATNWNASVKPSYHYRYWHQHAVHEERHCAMDFGVKLQNVQKCPIRLADSMDCNYPFVLISN